MQACSVQSEFAEGSTIFRAGEPANRFYLIQSGRIALEIPTEARGPFLVEMLGPGDVLGWSWFFKPFVWQFSARSVEKTSVQCFYGKRLQELCEAQPEFGYEFLKRLSEVIVRRLSVTRRQLKEVSGIALRSQQEAIRLACGDTRPKKIPKLANCLASPPLDF